MPEHEADNSLFEEFKNCVSVYNIPKKEDSDEISSEGEFNEARNVQLLREDDTKVYLIQKQQEYNETNFG